MRFQKIRQFFCSIFLSAPHHENKNKTFMLFFNTMSMHEIIYLCVFPLVLFGFCVFHLIKFHTLKSEEGSEIGLLTPHRDFNGKTELTALSAKLKLNIFVLTGMKLWKILQLHIRFTRVRFHSANICVGAEMSSVLFYFSFFFNQRRWAEILRRRAVGINVLLNSIMSKCS